MNWKYERLKKTDTDNFLHEYHVFVDKLPEDVAVSVSDAHSLYFAKYGFDVARLMLEGKTAMEIIEEAAKETPAMPIHQGEVDGVKFALYAPPSERTD